LQELLTVGYRNPFEALAKSLLARRGDRRYASSVILCRRQRKLVAMLWLAHSERALHVQPITLPESARELAIDKGGDSEFRT
jgi:hypothetical protein